MQDMVNKYLLIVGEVCYHNHDGDQGRELHDQHGPQR
jgi:hypothetical protein